MARHRTMSTDLLDPVTRSLAPALVTGVQQRAGEWIPPACPHCRAAPPGWVIGAWVGHCRMCGATWYRTRYRVGQPTSHRKGNAHPGRLPPRRRQDQEEAAPE